MQRGIYEIQKNNFQNVSFLIRIRRILWPHLFVLGALPLYMVRCGWPSVFMWLCKPHTNEDHAQCHATVVSSTNLLKSRRISASARTTVVVY